MSNSTQFWNKLQNEFVLLPSPTNLTFAWNVGSLLGLCIVLQVLTGFILTTHYTPLSDLSFNSVVHTIIDVNEGWYLRLLHANGASVIFLIIYVHLARGLYYGSYRLSAPWIMGIALLGLSMLEAFVGYVLPWGQISYWGATVITNLLSAIPYIGPTFVEWLWGGYSVSSPTLMRFYSIHFSVPFVIVVLILLHLVTLHHTGSSNPLGTVEHTDNTFFHPSYTYNDLLGYVVASLVYSILVLTCPSSLMDPLNFIEANPLSTPEHIQPEWYFLFAYSILRSTPTNLGGVLALFCSILVLALLPINQFTGCSRFNPYFNALTTFHIINCTFLTWLGSIPVEQPFVAAGQISSVLYFIFYLLR